MINNLGLYNYNNVNSAVPAKPQAQSGATPVINFMPSLSKQNVGALIPLNTSIKSPDEQKMYTEIVKALSTSETEKISPQDNVLRQSKLDSLLKSGVLLNNKSNDGTSVLENLYKAISTERMSGVSGVKVAGQIIDAIYDPSTITQNFGDIPNEIKSSILNENKNLTEKTIEVEASGTCVAASVEFKMADKQPAEFARWAQALTSPNVAVKQNIDLSALSKNPMDAIWLLNEFGVEKDEFNFYKAKLNIAPDKNAVIRAQIQNNHWDKGERTVLDVLFQSTLMQLGSQGTYDSLTDTRAGKFSSNNQGLIEFEKTFIESIVANSEKTSVVYQNLDNEQNIVGWNCGFDIIQKHITKALDEGEDVIVGCVSTAQECGETASNPNKIVNGHEMTIVSYKTDNAGNMTFICNDTDDDKSELVEYSAKELLPKIHHASYPARIVDELPVAQNAA